MNSVADSELFLHPFEFGTDPGAADGDQPDETQPGYFIVTAEIEGVEKTYFASLAGMIDVTGLQAGQFMKMQLSVQDGAAGGIGCQIVDWNTATDTDVIHRRPGVYSAGDAALLLQILSSEPVDLTALDRFCSGLAGDRGRSGRPAQRDARGRHLYGRSGERPDGHEVHRHYL